MSAYWSGFFTGVGVLLVIEAIAGLLLAWVMLPRLRARREDQSELGRKPAGKWGKS